MFLFANDEIVAVDYENLLGVKKSGLFVKIDENLSQKEILFFNKTLKNADKIAIFDDKIYGIFDKNKFYKIDKNGKILALIDKKFGRINDFKILKNEICLVGWDKNLSCYDDDFNLVSAKNFNVILTALGRCSKVLLGDLNGNLINSNENFKHPIKQIECVDKTIFLVFDNFILKKDEKGIKEVLNTKKEIAFVSVKGGEFIAIFKDKTKQKF